MISPIRSCVSAWFVPGLQVGIFIVHLALVLIVITQDYAVLGIQTSTDLLRTWNFSLVIVESFSAGWISPNKSMSYTRSTFWKYLKLFLMHIQNWQPLRTLTKRVSNINIYTHHLGTLLKCRFQFNKSGWGLRVYISNRLQGDAGITAPQNTF